MATSKSYIEACLACVITCEICLSDCITRNEIRCASLCRDCADICNLAARFEARGSNFTTGLHALCAEICQACFVECTKHADHHDTCRACAEACEKCVQICEFHKQEVN